MSTPPVPAGAQGLPIGTPLPETTFLPPPAPIGAVPNYASTFQRIVAIIVDTILLVVVSFIILLPFGIFLFFGRLGYVGWFIPFLVLPWLLGLAYFTYFEGKSGQTFGKRTMGIKVVSVGTGNPPDLGHAFFRTVLRLIDGLPVFYLLGFILVLATAKHQRLGDFVGNTIVVRV